MAKYVSGRQKNLKVGISSYSENLTSLEVIGNVGIATTNATSKLYVVGDGYFTGIVTASNFSVGNSLVGAAGSFSQLNVSGITTLGITSTTNLTSQQLNVSGVTTVGFITATNLYVSGLSTFTNGPVLVGTATSSGTASQRLQVTGGAYVSGNLGIGTTNPTYKLDVFGEGRFTKIFTPEINSGGASYVYFESSGIRVDSDSYFETNLGIGTLNPTSKLHVIGDVLIVGITTLGVTSTTNLTSQQLNVSGITTLGIVTSGNIYSTGVITATQFSTGSSGITINTDTISGPAIMYIDPSPVGVGTTSGIVRIRGDLYVDGAQFVVSSSIIELADLRVGIATTVGTSLLLDGGGIGIGSANIIKTITWNHTAQALTSSEDWNLASGKQYEIGGTPILSSTLLTVTNINAIGVTTVGFLTATNVSVSGFSTLGITSTTNLTSQQLNVSGITTLGITSATNLTSQQLNVSGITTLGVTSTTNLTSQQLNVSGISTLGITSSTNLTSQQLNVSGISTLQSTTLIGGGTSTGTAGQVLQVAGISSSAYIGGNLGIGTTNPTAKLWVNGDVRISGVVTATSFSGTLSGIASVTQLNVSGISTLTTLSVGGTTGINGQYLKSTGTGLVWASFTSLRNNYSYTSTEGQKQFVASGINTGYVDVFLNGIRLDETNYSITGTGVSLGVGAYDQDELTIVGFNTLNAGGASSQTLDQTLSFGNSSSLGMSIGVITATDYRIQSVAEKTTLVNGNTVSLVYNTGGGNVAICTNPSGNITLNVTGIPTASTFDNYSLAFSVIVTNTGTARSCTAINLNGVSETILWFGGSLSAAIAGVTTSNGYDVYSFTGINTVGSASTTSNYIVLGSVNGSYR